MDWIYENYEWVFSGVGIFIIGIIISIFRTKKKNISPTSTSIKSQQTLTNEIKAESVNINQTVIKDSNLGDLISNYQKTIPDKNTNPESQKIKEDLLGANNKNRTFIIKKLSEIRLKHPVIQVLHITDIGELEFGLKHIDTVRELEKIEEEGLIKFETEKDEILTPYTRIKLTEKYFDKL